MLSAQAMKSAVDNRVQLSSDIQRDQRLSDTFRVMRADIANAFHYRDMQTQMINEILKPTPDPDKAQTQSQTQTQTNTATMTVTGTGAASPLGTPRPTPIQVTNFVGEAESLYFTTTTNARTIRDSQESDLAKIGYLTKTCTAMGPRGGGSSKCLYRSVSPYLDADVTKGGVETMLVENVEEFKFRYLGPDQEDYVATWKTDSNGTEQTKDVFPYAVEITLTLHNKNDKKDKPVTGTILAPINFPNNVKKKKNTTTEFDPKNPK
jgi:hypothetical protein